MGQACKKNTPPKNNLKPPVTNYQRNRRYQLLLLSNEPLPNDHYFLVGNLICISILPLLVHSVYCWYLKQGGDGGLNKNQLTQFVLTNKKLSSTKEVRSEQFVLVEGLSKCSKFPHPPIPPPTSPKKDISPRPYLPQHWSRYLRQQVPARPLPFWLCWTTSPSWSLGGGEAVFTICLCFSWVLQKVPGIGDNDLTFESSWLMPVPLPLSKSV